ncbi:YggS family pyridoxal phosphate-dependent enzyme [Niameybacter massiliensis]|uniref:Pyridoxal phosphate homeostasis protein n=1 Tax=Holtiella tumoricola TaxID=3018743 RepID=A0AA42DPP8_9FIRM|nr:YggS family pyridoxal phosphate-dependent enzyme [Holtiella tumoricola]MDA3732561.1 YggS family pyridoxal phosphate-dependent enzyme [Holtiella tumoricola]
MKQALENIESRMAQSAIKSGRKPEDVTLIAVSKTYPVEAIEQAYALGCKDFGENKVQELMSKIENIQNPIEWHLIGHLQRNKVKYVVGHVSLIHSVDSLRLAKEIQKESLKKDVVTSILLEVNVAKEESKHGIYMDEVLELVHEISKMSHVRLKGFMTVAPYTQNPEENRSIFRLLYNLSVDIQKQNIDNISTSILSMGMSNDYEIAIEEGATHVRIGTALFGTRDYNR